MSYCTQKPWLRPSQAKANPWLWLLAWPGDSVSQGHLKPSQSHWLSGQAKPEHHYQQSIDIINSTMFIQRSKSLLIVPVYNSAVGKSPYNLLKWSSPFIYNLQLLACGTRLQYTLQRDRIQPANSRGTHRLRNQVHIYARCPEVYWYRWTKEDYFRTWNDIRVDLSQYCLSLWVVSFVNFVAIPLNDTADLTRKMGRNLVDYSAAWSAIVLLSMIIFVVSYVTGLLIMQSAPYLLNSSHFAPQRFR